MTTERQLLMMRHGEAAPGFPDHMRPLTRHGKQEARTMARWLVTQINEGKLATPTLYASPYVRAQQTAQCVSDALGVTLHTLDITTPEDSPTAVADWLLSQPEEDAMMLVTHMPLVGRLTGLLVAGSVNQGVGFPTAAIAVLKADVWAAGCARLNHVVQPSQLS